MILGKTNERFKRRTRIGIPLPFFDWLPTSWIPFYIQWVPRTYRILSLKCVWLLLLPSLWRAWYVIFTWCLIWPSTWIIKHDSILYLALLPCGSLITSGSSVGSAASKISLWPLSKFSIYKRYCPEIVNVDSTMIKAFAWLWIAHSVVLISMLSY